MSTKNEIVNMAASHLAYASVITDVTTDDSATAQVMNRFYDVARQSILRAYEWPFAYKVAALAVAEEEPTDDWAYSYTYPSDCLYLRWISDITTAPEFLDDMYEHLIHYGTSGREIYANVSSAYAGYTMNVTTEGRFPEDFAVAFSYLLALYCAPRVTAGDNSAFTKQIGDLYHYHLGIAKANAANEDGAKKPPDSEFIRARG